jgi:hypothetical protein
MSLRVSVKSLCFFAGELPHGRASTPIVIERKHNPSTEILSDSGRSRH